MNIRLIIGAVTIAALCAPLVVHSQDARVRRSMQFFQELTMDGPLFRAGHPNLSSKRVDVGPLGRAPALSSVIVVAVGSSNCGWELMTTEHQASTTCDHGGAQLIVAVREIGYGQNPIGLLNGNRIPTTANVQKPICIVNGRYSESCPAGYVAVGFMQYYVLDGSQGGYFQFQDLSATPPTVIHRTEIEIL